MANRPLLVPVVLFAVAGGLVLSRTACAPKPRLLSPEMERIGGITNDQYRETLSLKDRVRDGKISEGDWAGLRERILGRSPVAQTLALSALAELNAPADRTRALGLLVELARKTPADEALPELAGHPLDLYSTNRYRYDTPDGRNLVARWAAGVSDHRLRELASESVDLYDKGRDER